MKKKHLPVKVSMVRWSEEAKMAWLNWDTANSETLDNRIALPAPRPSRLALRRYSIDVDTMRIMRKFAFVIAHSTRWYVKAGWMDAFDTMNRYGNCDPTG